MNAAAVTKIGEIDPAVEIRSNWPIPTRKPSQLLVRVLACSIAFGDIHMLSGRLSLVLRPPSMPYIPGKDICASVEDSDPSSRYKKGDIVVTSRDFLVNGGIAEYAVVDETRTALKPEGLDVLQASAYPDSAVTAWNAVNGARLKGGERVLVLGGSGGVGTFVVQMVKALGNPSVLAATSTQTQLMRDLGVDVPIDYRTQDWWNTSEFKEPGKLFDVIVDCVGGNDHYQKSVSVLKSKLSGGRFVAVVGNTPKPLVQNALQMAVFAGSMMSYPLSAMAQPWKPGYVMVTSSTQSEPLEKVLELASKGSIRAVLEPSGPFPFSAEGVSRALALVASSHAHGKVVIDMAKL
ncbi:chaperonin 10-like protein [Cladochytrium replicatum]|nr:chaperonin 10-like protein [Cladochytrium replicatum]